MPQRLNKGTKNKVATRPETAEASSGLEAMVLLHELQLSLLELETQKTALQHSLEFILKEYKYLYEFAPVGYMTLDCDGLLVRKNSAMEELIGTRLNLLNMPFVQFIAEEERPSFVAFLKQVFKGPAGKLTCELKLLTSEQEILFVQMEAQVIESSKHCLVAVVDVTDLRLEEQKFHIMADNTYAWEFWLGPNGNCIYISPACKRITGYDAAEFMADSSLFFRIVHPDDRHFFGNGAPELLRVRVDFEFRIIHRSGAVHWIRQDGQIITAADGTNLGLRASNLDVTLERRLKRQLVDSVEELKKLTSELNLSEERERRRIALVLHDQVVQDLAIGKLNLDSALLKGRIADHPVLRQVESILESSIRDLRDLSLDLSSPVLYDMGLRAAIASLGEKLAGNFGFKFVFQHDCTPGATLDEDLTVSMFQFCREILVNAGKHAAAATVRVSLYQNVDRVILNIDDDGVGFDPSNCRGGFGILNVRQRVNNLGGNFKIQSAVGTGTRAQILIYTGNAKQLDNGGADDSETGSR